MSIDQTNQMTHQDTHEPCLNISLLYAQSVHSAEHHHKQLQVTSGTTIYEALLQVGWLQDFEEIGTWCEQVKNSSDSLASKPTSKYWLVGIYAQKKPLNYQLLEGDRIEIYRPLSSEPMMRRKRIAESNK